MARPDPLPTYQEIAKKACVSTKTVCNVFRHPDSVRPRTAQKVLLALRSLGVEDPSRMKVRLRPQKFEQTKSILFLESGMPQGALSSPVYANIIQAASNEARRLGWQFSLCHMQSRESLADALKNHPMEAILLFGTTISLQQLREARPGAIAVRLLHFSDTEVDCDTIDYDREEVCRLAATHLRDLGCKRVAFIGSSQERGNRFLDIACKLGMQVADGTMAEMLLSHGGSQTVNRTALVKSWNKVKPSNPQGVFVESDQITNAFYNLLAENSIFPQRDLYVVSCNAEELFLNPLHPRPATIDIHSAEIGQRGVRALIARVEDRQAAPSLLFIRPKLLEGDSRH